MEKATQTLEELEALSPEEIGEAFHELSINQIELEMQNEELRRTQVELETARESYFDLYDQAPVGYITLNEKGQILEANLTASSLLGESRKVLVRQMFSQFILKGDEDIYYLMRKQLFKTGNRQNCELRMRKKGGPDFCARLDATLGLEKGSGAAMALVMLNDITEQKMVRERLVESEMRYRALFEHAAMGVAMIETRTGRYYDINQEYCDFLGYTREEALNMTFQDVTYAEDVQENLDKNALLLSGKIREFTIEKRYVRKDGSIVWGTLTGSALWEPGQEIRENYHIALVQDITERKRTEDKNRLLNAELEHLALTDYLTNLYNRRYFMRRSAEEFKRARRNNHPLALLMLDIDRFKNINASLRNPFVYWRNIQKLKSPTQLVATNHHHYQLLNRKTFERKNFA